jgi:DNA-binding response OmpR family regulator
VGDRPSVLLVSNHPDTAELYAYALDLAGFEVHCSEDPHGTPVPPISATPIAVIMHLLPRHDPLAVGALLRQRAPGAMLIGLISVRLRPETLDSMLAIFDDVVMIPCMPDALVKRLASPKLVRRRSEQSS